MAEWLQTVSSVAKSYLNATRGKTGSGAYGTTVYTLNNLSRVKKGRIDCSGFVSSCLIEYGSTNSVASSAMMANMSYNGFNAKKYSTYSAAKNNIRTGDIIVFHGKHHHVSIYSGNSLQYYDWGSASAAKGLPRHMDFNTNNSYLTCACTIFSIGNTSNLGSGESYSNSSDNNGGNYSNNQYQYSNDITSNNNNNLYNDAILKHVTNEVSENNNVISGSALNAYDLSSNFNTNNLNNNEIPRIYKFNDSTIVLDELSIPVDIANVEERRIDINKNIV